MKRYRICASDLHIRKNRPQFRKDNYFLTVIGKFRQIIKLCNKYDADLHLAGDIFNSATVGHKVVNTIIKMMQELKNECYLVAGQHDQLHHLQDLMSSPLWTLCQCDNVHLVGSEGIDGLYGCGFEQEVPKAKKGSILLIHKSVTPSKPPFFLTDAISAKDMLKQYKNFDFIISGDYHIPFTYKKWNRTVINCGSMMRQNIDQTELEPRVYLLDTLKKRVKKIKLKIEPADKVFALNLITKKDDSTFSDELNDLVQTLKEEKKNPDFFESVKIIIKNEIVPKKVNKKINEILGGYHDRD